MIPQERRIAMHLFGQLAVNVVEARTAYQIVEEELAALKKAGQGKKSGPHLHSVAPAPSSDAGNETQG